MRFHYGLWKDMSLRSIFWKNKEPEPLNRDSEVLCLALSSEFVVFITLLSDFTAVSEKVIA